MKVVRTSNYDEEGPGGDEYVVPGTEGMSLEAASEKARSLNESRSKSDADYFVVKPDDYKLWEFEP
jgi:hypothetical protein